MEFVKLTCKDLLVHAMKAYGGDYIEHPLFLISALNGGG
jgi:hypothetical protein